MPLRTAAALALACALVVPCAAAPALSRVPTTGQGTALGVDSYVAQFQQEWSAIQGQVVQMRKDILAVPIPPPNVAGDTAAKLAIAAKYAALDGLMARAQQVHDRMLNHIMGDRQGTLQFGAAAKAPAFEERRDAAVKPQDDPTLRRSLNAPAAAPAARPAPAPRASFHSMSSEFSYNTMGGGVGAGFNGSMSQTATTGFNSAAPKDTTYGPGAGAAPGGTTWGDPAGVISAGAGTSAAGGAGIGASVGGLGATSGASDSKPALNPSQDSLSHNKSDVAEKAFERMQQEEKDAQARLQQQQQDAEQQRQQQQQMAMQAAQSAAQLGAQLAQNQNKNQQQAPQNNGGGNALTSAALQNLQDQVQQLQGQVKDLQDAQQKQTKTAEQNLQIALTKDPNAPASTTTPTPPAPSAT